VNRTLAAIVGLGLWSACGGQMPPDEAPAALDEDVFYDDVQPILTARCGNPTTCHGREDRPFALYARGANRANPADVFVDPPLSGVEQRANYERSCAFAVDSGGGVELLMKPLAERRSGVWHGGGDIFLAPDDREYRRIEAWVASAEEPP